MPAPVFYSVSMFGTADIKNGSPDIVISSGVASLTVAQTGNIGVGLEIEYNSLHAYIAPNRIGFDDGGTAELLPDTKIEGNTSNATGIVRFVEVTSGTWAGGDAAGWIYFEKTTGTFQNNEQINRIKPTTSNNIALVNGTIQGNIGGDNDEFVLKTATGGTPPVQTETTVTSIHHVWATLSAFEGAFTGASYINNADLTAADVVVHCCWYYDHDNYTVDSTATTFDWTGTTDSTRYLIVFTPTGNAESINNQRSVGVWDANKAIIQTDPAMPISISEEDVFLEGMQIFNDTSGTANIRPCVRLNTASLAYNISLSCCILRHANTAYNYRYGLYVSTVPDTASVVIMKNCVIYGMGSTGVANAGVRMSSPSVDLNVYHCTIQGSYYGIMEDSTPIVVSTNNAVFNNVNDFHGTITVTFNASDDGDGTDAIDWNNEATDWANVFVGYNASPVNLGLNNYTTAGIAIIEQATSLAASQGIWRDIAGNERGATPDIGAFEYVASGITLVIAPLDSAGLLDNVSLTQAHTLAIQELLSSGSLDNVVLVQAHVLAIQELLSSGSLDNVSLIQKHILIIQELLSSGALDNVDLIQSHILAVQELVSSGALDNIDLVQAHILIVQELLSSGAIDNVTLSFAVTLIVADMLSAGTLDNVSLTQKHTLAIQELLSAGTVDNVTLSLSTLLIVADALSAGSLDGAINLTQKHVLAIQAMLSSGLLDNVSLTQKHLLIVNGLLSSGTIDNIELIFSTLLVVSDLLSSGTIENTELTQQHILTVEEVLSSGQLDNVGLTQKHLLIIESLLSSGVIDNINFDIAAGIIYITLTKTSEYNIGLSNNTEYNINLNHATEFNIELTETGGGA